MKGRLFKLGCHIWNDPRFNPASGAWAMRAQENNPHGVFPHFNRQGHVPVNNPRVEHYPSLAWRITTSPQTDLMPLHLQP